MKKNKTRILIALVLIVAAWLAIAKIHAQSSSPQFFITWQAKSYAPAGYQGKILPTAGSRVTASFDLIDSGKVADLTGQTIYWYLNDELVSNTPGKQTVSFIAPDIAPGILTLRIQLPFYRNNFLIKTAQIPVLLPEAVIESPYPGGVFGVTSVNLKGIPYFFNVPNPLALSFSWSVNGQTAASEENPDELAATINPDARSGSTLNVSLNIRNLKNSAEAAGKNLTLTFAK